VNITLKHGSLLGKGHQTWQMNEINKLIWPNASGIGLVPAAEVNKTATIAKTYGVIKKLPTGATNYKYAQQAVSQLKAAGVDVNGSNWKPATVKLREGGK
jgi:NitT/TauT family transport system substrate-binding protein